MNQLKPHSKIMLKNSIFSSRFASKPQKTKRNIFRFILHWFNIISISFLVIWVVVGNLVAFQLEQSVLVTKDELVRQFPTTETNNSAHKLEQLRAKLGIPMLVKVQDEKSNLDIATEASQKEFDQVRGDLSWEYDNSTSEPSKSLQQYLSVHSEDIAAIRTHLLKSDIPRWEAFDLDATINYHSGIESKTYHGLYVLQQILIVDATNNSRLGRYQPMIDSLEAFWRLNQYLSESHDFLPQLYSMINYGALVRGLRKIEISSPVWQRRLVSSYTNKMFVTSLKFENFKNYGLIRNFPLRKGGSEMEESSSSFLSRILQIFTQPYFTLSAVDLWQTKMRNLEIIFSQDPCKTIPDETLSQVSSWNTLGAIGGSISIHSRKQTRRQIDMELTQKILRLREVASQVGKFPPTLIEIESSVICKNLRYVYQPSPDGDVMTISVSPQNRPDWLVERKGDIPLSYSTKSQKL